MVIMAADAASAQVFLRGQSEALVGDVVKVGRDGVAVSIGGTTKIVSWDRVRDVRGEHGAEAAIERDRVGDLWRARTRLERGDYGAAEGVLDRLAPLERGLTGPTPAVVFEGLVRCRLHRGATAAAIWSWLSWMRARGGVLESNADPSAGWIGGRIEGPGITDPQTSLLPSVPPVFLRDAALDVAASSAEWVQVTGADGGAGELAMLYRAAMRFEAGLDPETAPIASASEGVRLTADVVFARVGSEEQRRVAVSNLRARLAQKDVEPWVECWCRIGIGRSLVREQDADMRRQGVIQLLHAPSRFARVSPAAASIALAEAAVALHEMGDEQGALALKTELSERFGRSSAMGWARLRDIRVSKKEDKADGKLPAAATPIAPEGRGG